MPWYKKWWLEITVTLVLVWVVAILVICHKESLPTPPISPALPLVTPTAAVSAPPQGFAVGSRVVISQGNFQSLGEVVAIAFEKLALSEQTGKYIPDLDAAWWHLPIGTGGIVESPDPVGWCKVNFELPVAGGFITVTVWIADDLLREE